MILASCILLLYGNTLFTFILSLIYPDINNLIIEAFTFPLFSFRNLLFSHGIHNRKMQLEMLFLIAIVL